LKLKQLFDTNVSRIHLETWVVAMVMPSKHESDTRQRLIEAATEMFVEHGFDATKVREIVARAGANIAAVNYHFGSKEGLYAAVIQYHAAQVMEKMGSLSQRADTGSVRAAEARLADYVRTFLQRLLMDTPQFIMGKLIAREMIEPTAAFDLIIEKFVEPQFVALNALIRAIVGDGLSDETVRRCSLSVVGQCLYYQCARRVVARIDPKFGYRPDDIGRLAEHIVAFSLGGLRHVARTRGRSEQRSCSDKISKT